MSAVTRTILMPDDFHMAHLNRYGPLLNDNNEVSRSRIVSPKKAVLGRFFLENHVFDPFRPNEAPQVLYMAGKLWISSFW